MSSVKKFVQYPFVVQNNGELALPALNDAPINVQQSSTGWEVSPEVNKMRVQVTNTRLGLTISLSLLAFSKLIAANSNVPFNQRDFHLVKLNTKAGYWTLVDAHNFSTLCRAPTYLQTAAAFEALSNDDLVYLADNNLYAIVSIITGWPFNAILRNLETSNEVEVKLYSEYDTHVARVTKSKERLEDRSPVWVSSGAQLTNFSKQLPVNVFKYSATRVAVPAKNVLMGDIESTLTLKTLGETFKSVFSTHFVIHDGMKWQVTPWKLNIQFDVFKVTVKVLNDAKVVYHKTIARDAAPRGTLSFAGILGEVASNCKFPNEFCLAGTPTWRNGEFVFDVFQ